jgi:hypothetical protein
LGYNQNIFIAYNLESLKLKIGMNLIESKAIEFPTLFLITFKNCLRNKVYLEVSGVLPTLKNPLSE